MSKASLEKGLSGFTPVTLTIELTNQEDVDALYWLTSTDGYGLDAMKKARKGINKVPSSQNIHNAAYKLIGHPLSRYAYLGK